MRKFWLTISIIVGITAGALLAACGQVKPTSTPTNPAATESAIPLTMNCQVVSMNPTQGPTEASMFPPPGEDDWVHGSNPNARLTIIEYSDFQ